MTATQRFIKKAIDGGYRRSAFQVAAEVFLDPESWKAVGKVEGWSESFTWWLNGPHKKEFQHYLYTVDEDSPFSSEANDYRCGPESEFRMLKMVAALAEGKSTEEYLATIL